jgi:D-tyrosyl-tRNA(Tyr) deacylase
VDSVRGLGVRVETGVFQARMAVHILNDGPVTFILESRRTNPPRGPQSCF